MRRSMIYGLSVVLCCWSCSSKKVEKGVAGWWTIDEISYQEENMLHSILGNSRYFNEDHSCSLPSTRIHSQIQAGSKTGTWEVLETDTVPFLLKINSENRVFNGLHPVWFENNQEEQMLILVINSKSLHAKCRKGLINYISNESLIKDLEKMSHP